MRVAIYQPHNWNKYQDFPEDERGTKISHNVLNIPHTPIAIIGDDHTTLENIYRTIEFRNMKPMNDQGIFILMRSNCVGDVYFDVQTNKAYVCESAGFSEYQGDFDFPWHNR